ncbi:GNAT family N-acetyltransferase, partial [Patescibacteria group bacterium]|nr:GNAT family N-acetyltransferase [Patescibacteria group bacterium]
FSELEKWVAQGKYHSYRGLQLEKLLVKIKALIPKYVRIERLVRDIPGESIIEGSRVTNLRQELKRKYNAKCDCIRCREIRDTEIDPKRVKFHKQEYDSSGGKEFFLTYDQQPQEAKRSGGNSTKKNVAEGHNQGDKLCSMLRLRFPSRNLVVPEIDNITAVIREVHTYGTHLKIDKKSRGDAQHIGFGKKLILEAEKIAKNAGYKKLAVISSIGTREYYKKLGYKLEGTYMVKREL